MTEYDYSRPVEIANGTYWVGFNDEESGLHCNPFIIIDNDEAVLIDGGSRPHFPHVMMKILKTGLNPKSIVGLVYQHYDPDLCGSLSNLEDIINSDKLRIYSTSENHMFIRHYSTRTPIVNVESIDFKYKFKSGRTLRFIQTPFAHVSGSFITFDETSKVLFTSDLFGAYSEKWELFANCNEVCMIDNNDNNCQQHGACSFINGLLAFHRTCFPTRMVLQYAMKIIEKVDFEMIAPQHGSVLRKKIAREVMKKLANLDNVGIDRFVNELNDD